MQMKYTVQNIFFIHFIPLNPSFFAIKLTPNRFVSLKTNKGYMS